MLEDVDELSSLLGELVDLAERPAPRPSHRSSVVSATWPAPSRRERAPHRTRRRRWTTTPASSWSAVPASFERAISNLVDNAVKYSEGKSSPIDDRRRRHDGDRVRPGPGIGDDDLDASSTASTERSTSAPSRAPASACRSSTRVDREVRGPGVTPATDMVDESFEAVGGPAGAGPPCRDVDGSRPAATAASATIARASSSFGPGVTCGNHPSASRPIRR